MKKSVFYKYFLIIFAALILFEYANIQVDYNSAIEYRIALLEENRNQSKTYDFINKFKKNKFTMNEMNNEFLEFYQQSGYNIHVLVKYDQPGNYQILNTIVESNYYEPIIQIREKEYVLEEQDGLAVERWVTYEFTLNNFSESILKELKNHIQLSSMINVPLFYLLDDKQNLMAIKLDDKEYYANNVLSDEINGLDWLEGDIEYFITNDMEYARYGMYGTSTNVYFKEYYDVCIEQLDKIIPKKHGGSVYELKKDAYFKHDDGVIVYDVSYVGAESDLDKITYYTDDLLIYEDSFHDDSFIKTDEISGSEYFIYDFYYYDTRTMVSDVIAELNNSKGMIYIEMTVLALFVSFILSKMLTKHIKAITEVTTKISNNDFNAKLSIKSKDELGVLSSNINLMSDKLKETIDNLNQEIKNVRYLEGVRKEFIANFTHEIKTPLAIINGYIELLSKTEDGSKREEYLDAINKETNRMNKLIMSMLELTQFEAGKKELKISEISMDECLTEIVDSYLPLIKNKGINLRLNIDDSTISGDEEEIKKVISNFLSNAIKHTKENGYIEIKFQEGIFSIENEGQSISEEDRKLIFETYVSNDREGTGLGLAICKAILELHQFKYGVVNTEKGVKFYFMV